MSRSRRKTRILGNTTAASEKENKRKANRKIAQEGEGKAQVPERTAATSTESFECV